MALALFSIEERKRELATIKVLGFYKNELESYIFRENIILTILYLIVKQIRLFVLVVNLSKI